MKKSTGNNMQQAHVQMVKKVVEALTHRSRHPDIQLICCSGLLPCNSRKEASAAGRVEVLQFPHMDTPERGYRLHQWQDTSLCYRQGLGWAV